MSALTPVQVVGEFRSPGGVGERLHSYIQKKAKTNASWLADWWLQDDFLDYREPLVVFSSTSCTLGTMAFRSKDDQLKHQVPVDMLHGRPLDMSQYFRVFSTCRAPGIPSDELMLYGSGPDFPQHIVVIHNNRFFRIDAYHPDGSPLSPNQFFTALSQVVKMSPEVGEPLGLLTTENRDVWVRCHRKLQEDRESWNSIDQIQKSIFILCLDRPVPPMDTDQTTHALMCCYTGASSAYNGGNRWYDKCIQLLVSEDGILGMTVEHSPAEGYPNTIIINAIQEDLESYEKYDWAPLDPPSSPTELKFNISPEIKEAIAAAGRNLDKYISIVENTDVASHRFTKFSKNFLRSLDISPDSFVQMALQLSYYKLHGLTSMYEVATGRKFLHGRMEIVRGTTEDSIYMCEVFTDPTSSSLERLSALRAAVLGHKLAVIEATNGEGIECLIQSYKKASEELEMPLPLLFEDPGFLAADDFRVLSSQVPVKKDGMGVYCPRGKSGYGVHYLLYPDYINIAVCSYRDFPETDSKGYLDAILDTMEELVDLARSTKRVLRQTSQGFS
ncbi:CRAT [Cordylochernes scorpioides]|uniref:CRAT n=1 Tax=Cordylochernes scorpioides TaxID=51811 RepID=A0ABY6L9A7_9ARAC|nr:CRAT [Cordylochernes scorpioides]